MRSALVVAVVVAVLGTCTAAVVVPLVSSTAGDQALAAVPADATLYATAYVEPSLSQQRAVGELLSRFNVPREQVDSLLSQTIEPLAQIGLEYDRDIKPWLGNQVSLFVLPVQGAQSGQEPDGAVLVATEDVAATRAAVERALGTAGIQPETRTHAETEYQVDPASGAAIGYIGNFVVAGTERGFTAAVDASRGQNLSSREEYAQTASRLPTDVLISVWADPAALAGLAAAASDLPGSMGVPEAGLGQQQPTAVALRMEADALVFETATLVPPDAPPPAVFANDGFLGQLPSGAVAALGIPALGQVATQLLDNVANVPGAEGAAAIEEGFETQTGLSLRNDVLRWMGDAGLVVRGTSLDALDGGLVMTSSDPAATTRFVETLRTQAEGLGVTIAPAQSGTLQGFSVQDAAPAPVTVLGGDRLVIGYGPVESLVAPTERLGDSEVFGAANGALGGGWMPTLFIDVSAAVTLGETAAGGAAALGPTYATDVSPRLRQVRALIGGTRREGNTTRQRLAVLFADG